MHLSQNTSLSFKVTLTQNKRQKISCKFYYKLQAFKKFKISLPCHKLNAHFYVNSLGFCRAWLDFAESLSISGNGVHPEDKSRNLLLHGRRREDARLRLVNFPLIRISKYPRALPLSLCHQREVAL